MIPTVVPGVGGTSINGLDRYVPPDRVWFLRDPILNCIPGVILRYIGYLEFNKVRFKSTMPRWMRNKALLTLKYSL